MTVRTLTPTVRPIFAQGVPNAESWPIRAASTIARGIPHPGSHAIPDAIPLELSKGAAQLVEQLSHRSREVQALTERDERHISYTEALEQPDKMLEASTERSRRQTKTAWNFPRCASASI